jgi:cysteine desulfurase
MLNTVALDEKIIYLDYAATTPTDPDIVREMSEYFSDKYSNPSSLHTSGRNAKKIIEKSRKKIADIVGASSEEIIFTGSGTESDNLAILGIARANRVSGNHVIVSSIEHKAVLEPAKQLMNEGFDVSFAKVNKFGLVDLDYLLSIINDKTILVSIMYANNEIGTIQNISEISKIVKSRNKKIIFHTDACQATGFLPINADDLGVDLMTINSSKIYGPKGVGMLYKKKDVKINPIVLGGGQENSLRAGTESVPLIVGFTSALIKAESMRKSESIRLSKLRDYFIEKLFKKIPGILLNGHKTKRLPNNIHISIPFVEGESLLLMLDNFGIEVSTGSACSASDLQPSSVLLAIGQNPEIIHGSLRFSLGRYTTKKDLDFVLSILPGIVSKLSKVSVLTMKNYEKVK